jgi:hypothetical protein
VNLGLLGCSVESCQECVHRIYEHAFRCALRRNSSNPTTKILLLSHNPTTRSNERSIRQQNIQRKQDSKIWILAPRWPWLSLTEIEFTLYIDSELQEKQHGIATSAPRPVPKVQNFHNVQRRFCIRLFQSLNCNRNASEVVP